MKSLFNYYNPDGKVRLSGYVEWRWLTLLLFTLTAIFSSGFQHPDELYQVMEYMNVYQGNADPSTLSQLEWKYQMRPWFQPIFFHWLTAPLEWVGLSSPFAKSMFLRILCGLLACFSFSLWSLALFSKREEEREHNLNFEITLWWFIPYFAVRTSSDSIGALLILAALAFPYLGIRMRKSINWIDIICFSILSGLAFLFRYQTLIVTAPAILWMFFIARVGAKKFFGSILLVALIGLLEIPFNYLGYGEWVCSTWNHAYSNVILKISHTFGTLPFWGYFYLIPKRSLFIFGLLFMAVWFHLWFRRPKSLITWATLPYFIIFCFIGHKEVRFLAPLIFLSPIVFSILFNEIKDTLGRFGIFFEKIVYVILFLNLLIFPFANLKPANRYLGLYQSVYEHKKSNESLFVFYDNFDSSKAHLRFELNFYKKHKFKVTPVSGLSEIKLNSFLIATSKFSELSFIQKSDQCDIIYQSYPSWVLRFMPEKIRNRSSVLTLSRCKAR